MPLALVASLAILLWASFLPIYEPPGMADFAKLSWSNYAAVLSRPTTIAGLWNGLIVAGLSSTALSVLLALTATVLGAAFMRLTRRYGASTF